MTCKQLLARLDAAEARLARISAESGGHGVEVLWLDESARYDPQAVPDAFYVNRGDPYVLTSLYDVRQDAFQETSWGDWLETMARHSSR